MQLATEVEEVNERYGRPSLTRGGRKEWSGGRYTALAPVVGVAGVREAQAAAGHPPPLRHEAARRSWSHT